MTRVDIKQIEFVVEGEVGIHCNVCFYLNGNILAFGWRTCFFPGLSVRDIPGIMTRPEYEFNNSWFKWQVGRMNLEGKLERTPTEWADAPINKTPQYFVIVDVAKPGTGDLNIVCLVRKNQESVVEVLLEKAYHPQDALDFMRQVDGLAELFGAPIVRAKDDPDYKVRG